MNRSIAFAFLLLLSGSAVAQPAAAPDFTILKYNNPGLVTDLGVGLWAWPMPMDYDGDGDMDMVVSCPDKPYNGVYLFENKDGKKMPVFAAPRRLAGSLKDVQISYTGKQPRILVPGAEVLNFSKTFGTEKRDLFPADSLLKDFKTKPRFNQWKMADWDGDGDDDLLVGIDDWTEYGWDNAFDAHGRWTNGPLHGYVYLLENNGGKYTNRGRLLAGGKTLDVYGASSPNLADFDGDGDLDLICGEFLDRFTWFENTGTRSKPQFAAGRFLQNGSGVIRMDLEMIIPVAVDWNQDGRMDLVVGDEDGRVALVENTGKSANGMPVFASPVYFQQQAEDVKFGALATPFAIDWDDDGDQDIICGNSAGYIAFIENLGGTLPKWAAPKRLATADGRTIRVQAGPNGSIQGPAEAKWGYTTLSVADWDGDGLKDIVVNSIWGKIIWFHNSGTAKKARLDTAKSVQIDWGNAAAARPAWHWWAPAAGEFVSEWRTTPFATDWNKDGLTDIVMLDHEGYLSFFERARKGKELVLLPGKRIFFDGGARGYNQKHDKTDSTPGLLQLNTGLYGQSGRRKFTLSDWDGDGRTDLLVNNVNVSLIRNTGNSQGQVQLQQMGPLGKLVLAGHDTSPTTVDWNRDGIPDLLVGAEDGHFYYLQNRRTAGAAANK